MTVLEKPLGAVAIYTKTNRRMSSWMGATRYVVAIGPEPVYMEIPAGTEVHDAPDRATAEAMADRLGGYVALVFT